MLNTLRVVVLIGGNGSNLQALIDTQNTKHTFQIVGVISHRAHAYGLERAKQAGISTQTIPHVEYSSRQAFEAALAHAVATYTPDLIVLAGFMRLLSADWVKPYEGKIMNIHPSLLPRHPGLHTHERVIAARDTEHGASVHFVTDMLDGGPIIAQMKLSVHHDDTVDTLRERVFVLEHILYPTVVDWFAHGRLVYAQKQAHVLLDGQPLPSQGYLLTTSDLQGIET